MAQRKKCGVPRQITRYELRFRDGNDSGVYYINYPNKSKALAKKRNFRRNSGVNWSVHKIKRNVWVKKGVC